MLFSVPVHCTLSSHICVREEREDGKREGEGDDGGRRGREGDGRNKGKRREVDKYNVQNGTYSYVVEKNQRKGHTLFAHALNSPKFRNGVKKKNPFYLMAGLPTTTE